jgi:hypothetical protein
MLGRRMESNLFSLNELAEQWLVWITFGPALVALVAWIVFLVVAAKRWDLSRGATGVLFVIGVVGAIGLTTSLPLPRPVGAYEQLHLLRAPDGDRLVTLTRRVVSGRHGYFEHFRLVVSDLSRGERRATVELPSGKRDERPRAVVAGSRGGRVWVETHEGIVAVDVLGGEVVGREQEATRDLAPYRSEGFDATTGALGILRRDGTRAEVAIGPSVADGPPLEPLSQACAARAEPFSGTGNLGSTGNLLRARLVYRRGETEPCLFAESALRLALHRDTAFDEGAWLISALRSDDAAVWTLDLTASLGEGDFEVLLAEDRPDGALRLLVGRKTTIFAIELDARAGILRRASALY